MSEFTIHHGKVEDELPKLAGASFDGCFCDPPYGLSFMGKHWDHGVPGKEVWAEVFRVLKPGSFLLAFGGTRTFHRLTCAIEDAGFEIRDCIMWLYGSGFPKHVSCLKPAWEPIIVARKSGRGLLNIDGCRVGKESLINHGRWPANLILDEEAAAELDEQSGLLTPSSDAPRHHSACKSVAKGAEKARVTIGGPTDSGGASRFFYIPKADTAQRNGSKHPTMKPIDLCAYLAKLILPASNGRLLVPFSGSGSEVIGAIRSGWNEVVGIEAEAEYAEQSRIRIAEDSPLFTAESAAPIPDDDRQLWFED